ncbi:uncharacterized protein LOC122510032 [Leptopilina heterotoma]|uniref:uncharacterized protein LOC122510032 n=1 Tax=Leptopilina heterotoma TaxID=63436 RepID=UPI001CA99FB4|nr:uncharacterized protein LOC122510032 [Leptopilina heterotoma]
MYNSLNSTLSISNECSTTQSIQNWEDDFEERQKKLTLSKNKKDQKASLQTYLNSFPSLNAPLVVSLLQSDFKRIIKAAFPTQNLSTKYTTLFSAKWPKWASKIIKICSSLKTREVKEFFFENENLLNEGKHDAILALFLLPLCLTVVRNKRQARNQSVSFSKYDISKTFILHIEDGKNLLSEIENYESWLECQQQVVYPYVVFCGKIDQINQALVVLKKKLILFLIHWRRLKIASNV